MTEVTRPTMVDDDGTFTFGTEVDKAFVDSILDEVDDQVHSSTNPTIKPKATTDEVVAARGSKASLDARLDVSLEDDGTLKSQASLVTVAQLQSALGSRNVALNGDLTNWTAGGSAAPNSFTLTGAAATIARTGPAMGDTFTFGTGGGGFAAKLTRAGNDWKLTQDVIASADFAKFINVKGQKLSVAVKGKTALASHLRIVVDDGATTTASSYHSGGNTEEHLSATHTISNSATKVSVYAEGVGSNGDAYVGGFIFVFADFAPTDWSPLSVREDASATVTGVVNLSDQVLGAGIKSFGATPTFKPGAGATAIGVNGKFATNTTSNGNVGGGEDILQTVALEAGVLDTDGKAIRIIAFGRFAANANGKTVAVRFGGIGGTVVAQSAVGSTDYNNLAWRIEVLIIRTSATAQLSISDFKSQTGGASGSTTLRATPAQTLANAIDIVTTGTSAASASNDILSDGIIVETIG